MKGFYGGKKANNSRMLLIAKHHSISSDEVYGHFMSGFLGVLMKSSGP